MKLERPGDILFMLVSYFPIPDMIGEMKTKPTQHAVRSMNYAGIQPDFIIARSSRPLDDIRKKKVSTFCNVDARDVISAPDIAGSIYEIPSNFEKDNLGRRILEKSGLKPRKRKSKEWDKLVKNIRESKSPIRIGIVGKYFETGSFTLTDSYISVIEAVKHAAWSLRRKPEITWLDAEKYEKNPGATRELSGFDAVIVPGGFGKRGVEGKINAIKFVRENNIPFLGLCYGLQLAVIEFARNVCKISGAHTTEIDPQTIKPIIWTMPDQMVNIKEKRMGGSMRLGAYKCKLDPKALSFKLYPSGLISERHRHRYEVNNDYLDILCKNGLAVSGINPERKLVEIIELPRHKFFIASQFHPELKSRPLSPHPLFVGLIRSAIIGK